MDEKRLRILALRSLTAMVTIVLLSAGITKYDGIKLYASSEDKNPELLPVNNTATSYREVMQQVENAETDYYTDILTGNTVKDIGERYIKINKESEEGVLLLQDLYMERTVRITFDNLEDKVYTKKSISFNNIEIREENVTLNYIYNPDTFLYSAVFDIVMDSVYVYKSYENDTYIFIELLNPKDVYDKVIVVDAGHGGNDIGTYAKDMEYYEKDINLSVVLYLKELLDAKENYKVYYTRLTDEKIYLNPRLNLANDLNADLFLSIHCNGSEYRSAKGTEVLYGNGEQEEEAFPSMKLAEVALKNLTEALGTRNRGILQDNGIYIIGNSKIPVALVELGFMSNEEDMSLLSKKKNRKIAAESLYKTIIDVFKETEEVER